MWNLLKYLVGLHTQALQTVDFYMHSNFNKKNINIEIYAVLLLANLGAIYAFFVGICGW